MFAGLDDIDWSSMHHAYGPATEVPKLLRGLVADDPAVREIALDAMYGAVHHQGDVYACTLATVPFLFEAAATPGLPGRSGVVELLASIGGDDDPLSADDEDEDEEDEDGGDENDEDEDGGDGDDEDDDFVLYRRAERAVRAGRSVFLTLLDDDDPEVRAAAPKGLLVGRGDAADAVSALRARLTAETEPGARKAVVTTLATLARRAADGVVSGVDRAGIAGVLTVVAEAAADPADRLVALTELARTAPPPDVVARALSALDEVYLAAAPAPEPVGFETPTLIGAIRVIREEETQGRTAPDAGELVGSLARALGDHVAQRLELVTALLRHPQWERRYDALRPATVLMGGWRGDYADLVTLLGEQLLDPHPRLSALAGQQLEYLYDLAAPAADAIAQSLASAPRSAPHKRAGGPPPWIITWPSHDPTTGPTLAALARLGDERALPMLRWALEQDPMPKDVGYMIGSLGPAAEELVPLIRSQLRRRLASGRTMRYDDLVAGLGRLGEAALPALPELMAILARGSDSTLLRLIGGLGQHAAEAVPQLRRLLDDGSDGLAAAMALWQVEGDAQAVLPIFARILSDDSDPNMQGDAALGLAALGPAAREHLPRLTELTTKQDRYGWRRLHAAEATWRITGDPALALEVFATVWATNPSTRDHIVRCLVELGPAAAPMVPALRAELARQRRSTYQDSGWSSSQIDEDERLRRRGAEVLVLAAPGDASA